MARKASESSSSSAFERYAKEQEDLYKELNDIPVDESKTIKTGSVILDALITGTGNGIPAGTSICMSSEPGLGKSTIALGIARKICLAGQKVIYIDAEKAVTKYQLETFKLKEFLGKNFILFQESTFEKVEKILADLIYEPDLACVFIDSLTTLASERDIDLEESITGGEIASQARLVGKFIKKFRYHSRAAGVTLFFINQMRMKDIGARSGAKMKPAGGLSQEHNMDVHIVINHGDKLYRSEQTALGKQDRVVYGEDLKVKCVKNKFCRSGIELVLTLILGQGVSNYAAYTKWLINHGNIKQSGPHYTITINDKTEGLRGQIAVNKFLRDNADMIREYIDANGGFFLVKNDEQQEANDGET